MMTVVCLLHVRIRCADPMRSEKDLFTIGDFFVTGDDVPVSDGIRGLGYDGLTSSCQH